MRTIDRLPSEVLLAIFEFTTAPSNPTVGNFHLVVPLTHVSRQWREVLLSYGPIWSNIHIYGQDFGILGTRIERSQEAVLQVSIDVPPRGTVKPLRLLKLERNIQKAANLIRKCRDRVARLHVRMDCHSFQRLLGCEWPALEDFSLADNCSIGSGSHGGGYDGRLRLPRLKTLSIKGGANWPIKVATHLTSFKLRGAIGVELTTLTEFFQRNASLESLELIDLSVRGPSTHRLEERIDLPHLKQLSVRHAAYGCALALLNLPSLEHLRVSSRTRYNVWLDHHWPGFYSHLSITNLDARYYDSLHDRIAVVGSSASGTQSLCLTEFSPIMMGPALFNSLSNTSLSSVTSLSLIKDMPDRIASPPIIAAILDLLRHLPQVECMRLSPTRLAIGVLEKLGGGSELCPELMELEVTVTDEACEEAVKLVGETLKVRVGGCGRKMRRVERLDPKGLQQSERAVWDRLWREAGLERYLGTDSEEHTLGSG